MLRSLPLLTAALIGLAFGQASSTSYATPSLISAASTQAATSATPSTLTIVSGADSYTYVGCYNETTGYTNGGNKRAITGGNMTSEDDMTPERCFTFCGGEQYAGLEYGKECWCGPYLSVLSTNISASYCNVECSGQNGTACGGSLTLTLYNMTRDSGSGSGGSSKSGGAAPLAPTVVGVGGTAAVLVALGMGSLDW